MVGSSPPIVGVSGSSTISRAPRELSRVSASASSFSVLGTFGTCVLVEEGPGSSSLMRS